MAEIKVIIKDETGNQEEVKVNGGVNGTTPQKLDKNQQAKSNKKLSTSAAIAMLGLQRTTSYVTSNVGKWSGNSKNQTFVNNAMKVVTYGAMAYVNPYIALAAIALDVGTQAIDYGYQRYWEQKSEAQSQARAGGKGGYRR